MKPGTERGTAGTTTTIRSRPRRLRGEFAGRFGTVPAAASRARGDALAAPGFHEARCALEAVRLRMGRSAVSRVPTSPPTRISEPSTCS